MQPVRWLTPSRLPSKNPRPAPPPRAKKNRVWGSPRFSNKTPPANHAKPKQPRRENPPYRYEIATGVQVGPNLYAFVLNNPVNDWDRLGLISEAEVYRHLFTPFIQAAERFKGAADNAVSSAVNTVRSTFKEWNDKARTKGTWSSDRRIKKDLFGTVNFQGGVGYKISSDGCCVTVTARGFAQLEGKTPKLGIFNLVARGSGSIQGSYKYCWPDNSEEWSGGFRVSFSGGVQASLGVITWIGGAKVTGELGAGFSNYYAFESGSWDGWQFAVYGRVYGEWKVGWHYQRREFRLSHGGDVDVF